MSGAIDANATCVVTTMHAMLATRLILQEQRAVLEILLVTKGTTNSKALHLRIMWLKRRYYTFKPYNYAIQRKSGLEFKGIEQVKGMAKGREDVA